MSDDQAMEALGSEMDRMLRTAVMMGGQLLERRARRAADRARTHADLERRDQADARRSWIEARDDARRTYGPLTVGRRAEQATPAELAAGWRTAAEWSAADPVAAQAAERLTAEWKRLYPDKDPSLVGAKLDVDTARRLADEHAPDFYTRHHEHRLQSSSEFRDGTWVDRLNEEAAARLVTDWEHWATHGQLPGESLMREYTASVDSEGLEQARIDAGDRWKQTHLEPEQVDSAGQPVFVVPQARAAEFNQAVAQQELAHCRWRWERDGHDPLPLSQGEHLSVEHARTLAGMHAPRYYRADRVDKQQLVADWEHWLANDKQLPDESLKWQWASHVQMGSYVDRAADQAEQQLRARIPGASEGQVALVRRGGSAEALQKVWDDGSKFSASHAKTLAATYGPVWYSAPNDKVLQQDWSVWAKTGNVPQERLQEAWATWSGQGERVDPALWTDPETNTINHTARAEWLQRTWDQGEAERADAEAGRERMRPAAQNAPTTATESAPSDAAQPTTTAAAAAPGAAAPATEDVAPLVAVKTPAPEPAFRTGEDQAARDRIADLHEQAAEFYSVRYAGSPAQTHMEERFGEGVDAKAGLTVGFAPDGWRTLSNHLRNRGASEEDLLASGLSRRNKNGNLYDVFRNRITIAVRDHDDGKVVGFTARDLSGAEKAPKYLNTAATPAFDKGALLVGLAEAPEGARLVRVEGAMDAIAINLAGDGRVAGVAPMGTALTDTQAELLASRTSDGVVLESLDADQAGDQARARDLSQLARYGVGMSRVQLPGSDPADAWQQDPVMSKAIIGPGTYQSSANTVVDSVLDAHQQDLRAPDARYRAVEAVMPVLAGTAAHQQADAGRHVITQLQLRTAGTAAPLTEQQARDLVTGAAEYGVHRTQWAPGTSKTTFTRGLVGDAVTDAEATTWESQPAAGSAAGQASAAAVDQDRDGWDTHRRNDLREEAALTDDPVQRDALLGEADAADRQARRHGSDAAAHADAAAVPESVAPAQTPVAAARPTPVYDRVQEVDGSAMTPEALRARQLASAGFTRSTAAGVSLSQTRAARLPRKPVKAARKTYSPGQNRSNELGR